MRLRTKLLVAFLGFSVVPLGGVTFYSYYSSRRALREVAAAESMALAEDLGRRMDAAGKDLNRRIARLGSMPLRSLMMPPPQTDSRGGHPFAGQVMAALGEAAPFIESLEILPMPPGPPPPPGAGGNSGPGPRRDHASHDDRHPSGGSIAVTPPAPAVPPVPGVPSAQSQPARSSEEKAFVLRFEGQKIVIDEAKIAELTRRTMEFVKEAEKQAHAAAAQKAALQKLAAQEVVAQKSGARSPGPARLATPGPVRTTVELLQKAETPSSGAVLGQVKAQLRSRQLLHSVLVKSQRSRGEIPFAISSDGKIETAGADDQQKIAKLSLAPPAADSKSAVVKTEGDWVIATRKDESSGTTFGIARPIGDRLGEVRQTAWRNLLLGCGMVGLAIIGILPLSSRMTRNITVLTRSAEQLARGDLSARVAVRSKDEIGQLATAFNRMAEDLGRHEKNVVEQERLRKELELCRRIQEELLPHGAFRSGIVEARGISIPAREVGGDFFNYFPLPSGDVALLIGDVSGKGLPAALLMANLQATLLARLPLEADLAKLAVQLDAQIGASTPPEVYLTLFMGIFDPRSRELCYVNAGHNTQFAVQPGGIVRRLESTGRPLGLLPGGPYEARTVSLQDGDYLFFYTDGLSEAEDEAGVEFGTDQLEALLRGVKEEGVEGILGTVEDALRKYRGTRELSDDATMLLVKVGA